MKVSLVVTVLNEEPSIAALLESLISQTRQPDEIVIVDGGSNDKTVNIIKSYQKVIKGLKLLEFKTTRSEARNIGIRSSSGDVIVTTDAGCVAEKHWIKKITQPFTDSKIAARSLAFRKILWEKVGGFPEGLKDTAEDTMFNYNIIKAGAKIARVKDAIVYWQLPLTLIEGFKKIFLYAKGDARSGIWWHPTKKFSTHNIKIAFIYLRYIFALYFILFIPLFPVLKLPFVLGVVFYMFWAFKKVYTRTNDCLAGLSGVVVQFASDIAVMCGFLSGLITI
ncbi:MAG: hypothetical protein UT39_C0006G0007 [Candidatus Woesebacteria bacterium GW2011_GWA1_39_21]|uniref:Glycosyltransferase 2-like domain-containing protein n=1 Tax=Candidatus Woesebacteria bacterium GW2011_GWA1_39_21 TaxID=1618550 RepID=A0A0G0NF99_9BACT|nr:MAG: hypothetical protein UT39_C0006G0007 [Candidatus Woesebacteria bacterium GW2011_GWA1_39_21]